MIAQWKASNLQVQLENQSKKKTQGSTKIKVQFLTLSEMRDAFDAQERACIEEEKQAADKAAKIAAEKAAHTAQINKDIISRVFGDPISSYKWKTDLVTIAGVFRLATEGTVVKLTGWVKGHMALHPEHADNSRFAGLYANSGQSHNQHFSALLSQPQAPSNPSFPSDGYTQFWANLSHQQI
jgi:hypothetical protein